MKTELSEEEEIRASVDASCDRAEKGQGNEEATCQRSWIILRGQEVEAISRFLSLAQKSINNIKDVISKSQSGE